MKRIAALLTSALIATAAFAHEATGPNGGRLVDAGSYHVELVPKGQGVDVYVTDANDKPVPVAGYRGTAVLVVGGKPQRIALEPAGANRLSGPASVAIPANVKGAVQLQTPAGAVQGRFQ